MEIIPVEKCFCEGGLKDVCSECINWLDILRSYSVLQDHLWKQKLREYSNYLNAKKGVQVKHHEGNGKPKGIFAGTLTMSTRDPLNQADMIAAIRKIMRQKSQPVKRYCWYLEYTKADVPHIHFIYETQSGGRITAQTFKRHWKIWDEHESVGNGHRGGYHKYCHDEKAYMDYIMKDNNTHSENKWTN